MDRFDLCRVGMIQKSDDETSDALRSKRHLDARADPDVAAEFCRDRVREAPLNSERDRDLSEFGHYAQYAAFAVAATGCGVR